MLPGTVHGVKSFQVKVGVVCVGRERGKRVGEIVVVVVVVCV